MSAERKPVAPFYAVAVIWLLGGYTLPLYQPVCAVLLAIASVVVFLVTNTLCRGGGSLGGEPEAPPVTETPPSESRPAENPELEKMLREGREAIAEMKRLNDNIPAPEISADIARMEQITGKIFQAVQNDPSKLPQVRRFMDYYLPTTLKLLRAYDQMSNTGVSGENIDRSLVQIETMMRSAAIAFSKQLDGLYGNDALDISAEIAAMETMLAKEGLTGQELKADPVQTDSTDIRLEL